MKLLLSIFVYGAMLFSGLLILFVVSDVFNWFYSLFAKRKKKEPIKVRNRVSEQMRESEFLKKILNAKPEAPEDFYER